MQAFILAAQKTDEIQAYQTHTTSHHEKKIMKIIDQKTKMMKTMRIKYETKKEPLIKVALSIFNHLIKNDN